MLIIVHHSKFLGKLSKEFLLYKDSNYSSISDIFLSYISVLH